MFLKFLVRAHKKVALIVIHVTDKKIKTKNNTSITLQQYFPFVLSQQYSIAFRTVLEAVHKSIRIKATAILTIARINSKYSTYFASEIQYFHFSKFDGRPLTPKKVEFWRIGLEDRFSINVHLANKILSYKFLVIIRSVSKNVKHVPDFI